MSYCFLEGLTYSWQLVRETPRSQKFIATVTDSPDLKAAFDFHYTTSQIAYVSVTFIGPEKKFRDGISNRLLCDMNIIVRRYGGYEYIDFSVVFTEKMIEQGYVMENF